VLSYSVSRNLESQVSAAPAGQEPTSVNVDTIAYVPEQGAKPEAAEVKLSTDDALNARLKVWAAAQPTSQRWGIVVTSLDDTSVSASYNSQDSFGAASIYKLYLTQALSKVTPFEQWSTQKVSGERTYADCVKAMMIKSDNPCAVALGDRLGWGKVTTQAKTSGYTHTSLNNDPSTTTPADTAQFLADLYNRKNMSEEVANFVLDAMSHSAFKKGIVAGCPDCQVANKTGDANGALHDTAIITVNGQHYVLAIFSQGGSQKQIAAATKLVHDYLLEK
jgi:hypothetical protein